MAPAGWPVAQTPASPRPEASTAHSLEARLSVIKWTLEEHGTGVLAIDREHAELFRLLNRMIIDLNALRNSLALCDALLPNARLMLLTATCLFAHEEHLFNRTAYPNKRRHCGAHRGFERSYRAFLEAVELHEWDYSQLRAALVGIQAWFHQHIRTMDQPCVPYLPARVCFHRVDGTDDSLTLTLPPKGLRDNRRPGNDPQPTVFLPSPLVGLLSAVPKWSGQLRIRCLRALRYAQLPERPSIRPLQ